jgi:signal transduction histidine kinase/CheY-like chemotaxis protein
MKSEAGSDPDYRVALLAPTRRDGEATCGVLQNAGLCCLICEDAAALIKVVDESLGAIVLTDAIATDPVLESLLSVLGQQPPWSDLPTILLSRTDRQSPRVTQLQAALSNVTVIDRPTSKRTLVSSVKTAIRGRRRQYQIRDQLHAVRKADEDLRTANRRKDEFLAMLAHELRNPLAPLRTSSELLARTLPPDARTLATLAIVRRQVTHLTRLVDDLLDVSRITQGRVQLQKHPVELSLIISHAMESAEPLLRAKAHKVTLTSSLEPIYVDGDSARLIQCVTNLLTNAAKYTDAGGEVRIEVGAENGNAVVSVDDTGVGISADLLPQIFGLFVQSDRSLDRSEGGLGIGLSVAQGLVEMHGGRILASSRGPGCGSRFEIQLPMIPAPLEIPGEAEPVNTEPRRILIVDDNVDAAVSLAEVLQLDGHAVQAVHSARAALSGVETFDPDLVLLDIGLPDMDGYRVAEQIRASGNPVRLVALTGYGQAEDLQRARVVGFNAHMVKPVDFKRLGRIVAGRDEWPSSIAFHS